jgi:hypothetical protein
LCSERPATRRSCGSPLARAGSDAEDRTETASNDQGDLHIMTIDEKGILS